MVLLGGGGNLLTGNMTGASPEIILSLKMKGFAMVMKNVRAYGVCMGHGM